MLFSFFSVSILLFRFLTMQNYRLQTCRRELWFQSTHSRRVRLCPMLWQPFLVCFNPRTHEECDIGIFPYSECLKFQSTHSRRARQGIREMMSVAMKFQSTHSRRARRGSGVSNQSKYTVSIHALTKSATTCNRGRSRGTNSFNPRTHEERDPGIVANFLFSDVSIHALTKSATPFERTFRHVAHLFQSTHSRRARLDFIFKLFSR